MYQIENEYGYTNPQGEAYFGNLEAQAKADGIDVPTYTNDVGSFANGWAPGTPDAPDLIGSDQYPEGFDCSEPQRVQQPAGADRRPRARHPADGPRVPGRLVRLVGRRRLRRAARS